MKGYLIKVTYLEGEHKGRSYLLEKGGYVASDSALYLAYTAYKTLRAAKGVCTRLYKDNEAYKKLERATDTWNIKHGKRPKDFYIYKSCSYEPFEVEVMGQW